jgi:hypothetical protein
MQDVASRRAMADEAGDVVEPRRPVAYSSRLRASGGFCAK